MEMKLAEIEIARDSFVSWDYHIYAGIEISILEILVHFRGYQAVLKTSRKYIYA